MKIADIKIGETYLTKVSGALVKVVVADRVAPGLFNKIARFRVRRVDNGKTLDKSRTASALRPLPAPGVMQALLEAARAAAALETEGRWAEALDAWNALAKDAANVKRLKMSAYAQRRAEIALAKSSAAEETAK